MEIEIKVHIEFYSNLLEFLNENANFKMTTHQVDEYFIPIHRNFIENEPINEWLRLRKSNHEYCITYKDYHYNSDRKSDYCDEYETRIQSITQLRKILKILDFKSIIIVRKIRDTWEYNDYEISNDIVENLGNFIEIEYKGKNNDNISNPKDITNEMMDFLKKIGVGKIERNYLGYPYLLLNKQRLNKK